MSEKQLDLRMSLSHIVSIIGVTHNRECMSKLQGKQQLSTNTLKNRVTNFIDNLDSMREDIFMFDISEFKDVKKDEERVRINNNTKLEFVEIFILLGLLIDNPHLIGEEIKTITKFSSLVGGENVLKEICDQEKNRMDDGIIRYEKIKSFDTLFFSVYEKQLIIEIIDKNLSWIFSEEFFSYFKNLNKDVYDEKIRREEERTASINKIYEFYKGNEEIIKDEVLNFFNEFLMFIIKFSIMISVNISGLARIIRMLNITQVLYETKLSKNNTGTINRKNILDKLNNILIPMDKKVKDLEDEIGDFFNVEVINGSSEYDELLSDIYYSIWLNGGEISKRKYNEMIKVRN
ncbi:hypothetical protein Q9G86_27070 [Bacillus thuringiensis]|uniref:hypothetical protein n=1 Tax=Bacillus thuringiensis TaxID=1428 RepID=UPI00273B9AFF|nr:hypothetical protein [Bacillus thuringiensis]WLP64232.1 hypothetical protein Q9G86_27070 [Bacillus thuringiensis]